MNKTPSITRRSMASAAISLALASLTACGGGGGGTIATPTVMPNGNNTVPIASPVVIPLNTNGAEQGAVYNRFNTARLTCGFGSLLQNKSLDSAAANHIIWMVENSTVGHQETVGTPGFTGVDPWDRGAAAGYAQYVQFAEVLTAYAPAFKYGFGDAGARTLLSAPYHLAGIMLGNREIGISVLNGGDTGSGADITYPGAFSASYLAAEMAASTTIMPQTQAAGSVLTYPCDGVTGTGYALTNEIPNPVPGRDLAKNPIGQPIYVQTLMGSTLVIGSVSMTGPNGAVQLLSTLTSSNDSNGELTSSNVALIMPGVALSPDTPYQVNISGTVDGVAFTKSFTFSTGS